MPTVMIVDDQTSVRRSLRRILERHADIQVIAEAASGPEAVTIATREVPDVVLMDIRMPGGDGITATRALTAKPLQMRVLVITTFDIDDYILGAIDAGAIGFLMKAASPNTYVEAIRAAAHGDGMLSPQITPRVLAAARGQRREIRTPPDIELLTAREIQIVRALANGISSTKAMAAHLHIEQDSVKGHLKRIRAKLGIASRSELVTWAFRSGIVS